MRAALLAATAGVLLAPVVADARAKRRVEVTPYLEVDQTALVDLKGGGRAATYTTLAAGVDAVAQGTRAQGQASYRFEYRHGWGSEGDATVHTGLGRVAYRATTNLTVEGGALATRVRTAPTGSAFVGLGNPANVSQLFSVYAGPTFAERVGVVDTTAYGRVGYTSVDSRFDGLAPVGVYGIGQRATDYAVGASAGVRPYVLAPVGVTLSANYTREETTPLDGRFEDAVLRADATLPVSPTLAVVGSVGYEKLRSSQRTPLRDAAGALVLDDRGRLQSDPAAPRLLTYDQSGFIWDTGVLWRPSRRTSLEARVGRRYGDWSVTGSFSYRPTPDEAVAVTVYDGVGTYGRQVNDALARVPTRFVARRDPFDSQFAGCVFGGEGTGAGTCLDPALESVAGGTFRTRGVQAVYRRTRGVTTLGLALGYTRRHFLAPPVAGFAGAEASDDAVYAQAFLARRLAENSGIEASVYADLFRSGVLAAPRVLSLGASGTYYRSVGRHLTGTASLGLYATDVEDAESTLVGAAQLGLRYQF